MNVGRIPWLFSESVWLKTWLSSIGNSGTCLGQFQCVTGKICAVGTEENGCEGKGGGAGHLEMGSGRNGCFVCGCEAAGGCPGRSWALTGPWEESAWNGACSLSPCPHSSLVLFCQHPINNSLAPLTALTSLGAPNLSPLPPSVPHKPGVALDANPASKMDILTYWEAFLVY